MPSGKGTAIIDFGATPASEASVSISGQTEISATSSVEAWMMARSTVDNSAENHKFAAIALRIVASEPTPGDGFVITAYCLIGYVTGTFEIEWVWSD